MDVKLFITKELASDAPASAELLQMMLAHIGAEDSKLRDEIIYGGWITLLEGQRLSAEQKHFLLEQVFQQNLLFQGITEEKTAAVFTRSFANLLLAALVTDHLEENWLTETEQRQVIETTQLYFRQEQDSRGYLEEGGWAHAFAHGADLLGASAELHYFTRADAVVYLELIQRAIVDVENFLYGEEERLAAATLPLLRQFSDLTFLNWLKESNQQVNDKGYYHVWWQHYLKSLQLMLDFENLIYPEATAFIYQTLKAAYQKYYVI